MYYIDILVLFGLNTALNLIFYSLNGSELKSKFKFTFCTNCSIDCLTFEAIELKIRAVPVLKDFVYTRAKHFAFILATDSRYRSHTATSPIIFYLSACQAPCLKYFTGILFAVEASLVPGLLV